ncbi:MAG: hypothetical protein GY870_11395 [archaeon]|nr:hypothetical protein [archaeon]
MLKSFNLKENAPRLVILGNSNVGKSSITRFLINRKNQTIGKIGKHAGSTVSLNLYSDPNIPYQIVDLPGYGAMTRTGKDMRERIQKKIIQYVEKDSKNIFLALVIFNCIRVHDELDKWYYKNKETIPLSYEFVTWLNELKLPSIVVLNKMDRVKKRELTEIENEVKKIFSELNVEIIGSNREEGEEVESKGLLMILPTSAKIGTNMKELKELVNLYFNKKFPKFNLNDENVDIFKEKAESSNFSGIQTSTKTKKSKKRNKNLKRKNRSRDTKKTRNKQKGSKRKKR